MSDEAESGELAELPETETVEELAAAYDERGLKLPDRFKAVAVLKGRLGGALMALAQSGLQDGTGYKDRKAVFRGDGKLARTILSFAKAGSALMDEALECSVKAEQLETRGTLGESSDPVLPAEAEPDERALRIDEARKRKKAAGG